MYKYTYVNKKTGVKVYSNEKLDRDDLELICEIRNTQIHSEDTTKKEYGN